MFTGIIEEVGKIQLISSNSQNYQLQINAKKVLEDTKIGDSIAVNGLCLTVSTISENSFTADVMPVSLEKSALKYLQTGSKINLERALQPQSRMGGHFVSGHIDGIGRISHISKEQNAVLIRLEIPPEISEKAIPEGSIAVDGISLTIARLENSFCAVSLIPHTFANTNFQTKSIGDFVNLESDMLGKYVYYFMQRKDKKLDLNLLQENGFF
jgi:riboflavin synthase